MAKINKMKVDEETGEIKQAPGHRTVFLEELFEHHKFLKARGISIYAMTVTELCKYVRREREIENERYARNEAEGR